MRRMGAWHRWLLPLAALAGLILGGTSLSHASAEAGAAFTPGPEMKVARDMFSLATLPGGKVGIFGGETYGSGLLANAEIWDPSANAFTLTGMNYTHYFSGLAKLADGNYLLAGGWIGANTAEIFHPGANTFTPTAGHLTYGRYMSQAATLTSGKVLVAGGNDTNSATYGELFDPATGNFAATQALNTPRTLPLVLPCNDGKAVVLGGHNPTDSNIEYERVELYNPVTNGFSILQEQLFPGDPGWTIMGYTGGMGVYALKSVETQRLQDGRYLFLAKKMGSYTYTLFTFDPATKAIAKFSTTPAFPASFHLPYCPVLDAARGKAYLLSTDNQSGGFVNVRLYTVDLTSGQRNDPTGSFPLTSTKISQFGITLLGDGRLFLAGGVEIVDSAWQSVKKTWFINPHPGGGIVGSRSLLLLD